MNWRRRSESHGKEKNWAHHLWTDGHGTYSLDTQNCCSIFLQIDTTQNNPELLRSFPMRQHVLHGVIQYMREIDLHRFL
jgi:hypothetical protein